VLCIQWSVKLWHRSSSKAVGVGVGSVVGGVIKAIFQCFQTTKFWMI